MITALDQVRINVRDIASAATSIECLLAREPVANEETAVFRLDNLSLELAFSDDAQGLAGLAFEIDDAAAAFRTCERRALKPSGPTAFVEGDAAGVLCEGRHVDLATEATFGVPITLVEFPRNQTAFHKSPAIADGAVTGLDHVVIRTTHPNRAAALYGARLGLDMRLDRTAPEWGTRLMFFRCGDLIVEVVHNLKDEPSDAPDRLWGLSWRVADADIASARLKSSAFDVSEVRPGRKPGTRVFTVRNNTLGVPTLFVEPVVSAAQRT